MTIETLQLTIDLASKKALAGDEAAMFEVEWATEQLIELQKVLGQLPSQK